MTSFSSSAYLDRIAYRGPMTPDLATLRALQRHHLVAVPFENLDIHLGRPIVLDTDRFYDKIVRSGRGGFCYELNGLFGHLLRELGFGVDYLSARVHVEGGDYSPAFDHLALGVRLEEGSFLVDVGFGKFALGPLRMGADTDQVDPHGVFRLSSRTPEDWQVDQIEVGAARPQYRFGAASRSLAEFAERNRFHQEDSRSHFRRKMAISKPTRSGGRITLDADQLKLTYPGGQQQSTAVENEGHFYRLLEEWFQIRL